MRAVLFWVMCLLAVSAFRVEAQTTEPASPPAATQTQVPPSPATPPAVAQPETPPAQPQAEAPAEPSPLPPAAQPDEAGPDLTEPDPNQPVTTPDDGETPDDLSIGEIPVIETIELTLDMAKRALDSYALVSDKYKDADLESYENLQDFVDQNPDGKTFEADVKAAGFANVNEWNQAITAVSFAYVGVVDDQSADIQQQIKELQADTELAQDMKDRMIKSLQAMIPSENNRKIIEQLMADPAYADKLKQLDVGEE